MIGTLVRHHPMMRPVFFKWLILAIAVTSMWTVGISMQIGRAPLAHPWLAMTVVWLPAALYLLFGPQTRRARQFPLPLPIRTRSIWTAHLLTVALVSGTMMVACLGFMTLALQTLADHASVGAAPVAALLPRLWSHGVAWWLILVAFVLADRNDLLDIPRTRLWRLRQLLVGAGAYAALVVSGMAGPALAVPVAIAAIASLARTRTRVPAAMSLAPREPMARSAASRSGSVAVPLAPWRRTPMWLTIFMAASKFPAMLLVAAPFILIVGAWLAGYTPGISQDESLGALYISVTAYCLFAVAAAPLTRLSFFDHLPIPRRRLLASLLLPVVVMVGTGFGVGSVLVSRQAPAPGEPLTFGVEPEAYGVHVARRHSAVAWSTPPVVTAPDGTDLTPPVAWRPLGSRGPVLYEPFHTPAGASLEACAWQLERASARVFDHAIPAEEFATRYLDTDPVSGRVVLRDGRMALRRDHPDLVPRRVGNSPTATVLLVGLLFQLAFAAYLRCFRPAVTGRVRTTAFVGILCGFLMLHLAPFGLAIADILDPVAMTVMIRAAGDGLAARLPGGPIGTWVLVAVLLAAGHRLVLRGFRRAEWPPVREDDAMFDVLG